MGRGNWDLERVEKQEASEKIKSEKSNEIIFSLWFWIKSQKFSSKNCVKKYKTNIPLEIIYCLHKFDQYFSSFSFI